MITKSDLAQKKITRIDVFYDNNKKPTVSHTPKDGEKTLKFLLDKMNDSHKA